MLLGRTFGLGGRSSVFFWFSVFFFPLGVLYGLGRQASNEIPFLLHVEVQVRVRVHVWCALSPRSVLVHVFILLAFPPSLPPHCIVIPTAEMSFC